MKKIEKNSYTVSIKNFFFSPSIFLIVRKSSTIKEFGIMSCTIAVRWDYVSSFFILKPGKHVVLWGNKI